VKKYIFLIGILFSFVVFCSQSTIDQLRSGVTIPQGSDDKALTVKFYLRQVSGLGSELNNGVNVKDHLVRLGHFLNKINPNLNSTALCLDDYGLSQDAIASKLQLIEALLNRSTESVDIGEPAYVDLLEKAASSKLRPCSKKHCNCAHILHRILLDVSDCANKENGNSELERIAWFFINNKERWPHLTQELEHSTSRHANIKSLKEHVKAFEEEKARLNFRYCKQDRAFREWLKVKNKKLQELNNSNSQIER
jgi:hypothetical protein